jgi:integrase
MPGYPASDSMIYGTVMASHLLQAGVHPKIVQERLGHSSIAVTIDTYSHLVPSLQEMAAQRIETIIGEEAME